MSNSRQWKITYQDSCLPGWSESCEKRNCKLKLIPSVRELVNWILGLMDPRTRSTFSSSHDTSGQGRLKILNPGLLAKVISAQPWESSARSRPETGAVAWLTRSGLNSESSAGGRLAMTVGGAAIPHRRAGSTHLTRLQTFRALFFGESRSPAQGRRERRLRSLHCLQQRRGNGCQELLEPRFRT